jgi:hypothetical protein
MEVSELTEEIKAIILPVLNRIALDIRTNAIRIIDKEKLVYTGKLRRSIQAKVKLDSDDPHILVYVADAGDMKYAKYIHEGIKPHMPPLDPIREWVRKKGLHRSSLSAAWNEAKASNKGKPRAAKIKKGDLETRAINNIAWAVAIAMKKKGRKPTPFLKLAIQMALGATTSSS